MSDSPADKSNIDIKVGKFIIADSVLETVQESDNIETVKAEMAEKIIPAMKISTILLNSEDQVDSHASHVENLLPTPPKDVIIINKKEYNTVDLSNEEPNNKSKVITEEELEGKMIKINRSSHVLINNTDAIDENNVVKQEDQEVKNILQTLKDGKHISHTNLDIIDKNSDYAPQSNNDSTEDNKVIKDVDSPNNAVLVEKITTLHVISTKIIECESMMKSVEDSLEDVNVGDNDEITEKIIPAIEISNIILNSENLMNLHASHVENDDKFTEKVIPAIKISTVMLNSETQVDSHARPTPHSSKRCNYY